MRITCTATALAISAVASLAIIPGASSAAADRGGGHAGPAATGQRIIAHASEYGRVIFTGQRRAIYLFARDRGKSTCYGACAKAWPPVLTHGKPLAGAGVSGRLLGSVRRTDGTRQVTYAGHPLYRFVGDHGAFQITCQNVAEFGGTWLVVTPAGRAVR